MENSKINMTPRRIRRLLSDELILPISNKYDADYKAKKLSLKNFLVTILTALFGQYDLSLRSFAKILSDDLFQLYVLEKQDIKNIDHTAFHYRFKKMPPICFQEIFNSLKAKYRKKLEKVKKEWDIWIFDSTIVSCSAKELKKCGFQGIGSKKKRYIKYTMATKNGIPTVTKLYCDEPTTEEVALKDTILATEIEGQKAICLFDRGTQSRALYDELTRRGIYFISRLKQRYRSDIIKEKTLAKKKNKQGIKKVIKVYLFGKHQKKTEFPYWIIHIPKVEFKEGEQILSELDKKKLDEIRKRLATKRHQGKDEKEVLKELFKEDIIFVTNIPPNVMSAKKVAKMYRRRWGIETFFKFMKQRLKFSHLVNRTKNGILSMMYITMIAALMLMVYKVTNKLKGFKQAHDEFRLQTTHMGIEDKLAQYQQLVRLLLLSQFW